MSMQLPLLNTTERPWDGWLLVIVCALLGLGVVMIYSASGITAAWNFNDSMFFLKRQLIYVVIGFGLLIMALKVDYHWYQRLVYPILIGVLILLALVLVAGTEVNGSRRWIRLASFNIQPAEVAKIAMAFVLAYSMVWQPELMEKLIQCAAAIGYGIFGSALLYSCFRILPELRRKG